MLLILLNSFNAPNQGVPVPKRLVPDYQALIELTYDIYGSGYDKTTHDLHFHINEKPVTADDCGPTCSDLLFNRGAYDDESTSGGERVTLYAHFVLNTTVKQDPEASDHAVRGEVDSDIVELEEAPDWPLPHFRARRGRETPGGDDGGDDPLAVEHGAEIAHQEAVVREHDATAGAGEREEAPAYPPLPEAATLARFKENFTRLLEQGPPQDSRVIQLLKKPYQDYSDKNKRQIIHATLQEGSVYGVEARQECNKCAEEGACRIYHPAFQTSSPVGRTCLLCRIKCWGPCSAE